MANICFFSAQYLPHMGGVENYTYNISKELIKLGHTVTVVTSHVEGLEYYEINDGIEIYRLPSLNLMNGRLPILNLSDYKKEVIKELKEKNFDLAVINTRFYFLSLFGARFAHNNKIKSIIIEHGTGHLQFDNPILKILENIYEHSITFLDKIYVKDYYGVSYACIEWLKHFHIKGKGVLYNSINPNITDNIKDNIIEKDNKIKFCFVGRIIKEKGILELLEAYTNLKKKYPNISLYIAGEGPLETEIKKHLDKDINYLGRLPREKVISLLIDCDIFCLPSVSEGFSTAVLEAAICKAYIITTKQGGSKELIVDESYGSIIENNQVDNLMIEMERIINNFDKIENCVNKTYNSVIDNFTWEKTARSLAEIIK